MVIPLSLTPKFITDLHASPLAGHPGNARSLHQARLEYCWPTMCKDINSFIDKCQTSAEYKSSVGHPAPLKTYPIPREPWEAIVINLLKLPVTTDGHKYLLVAIDHFSQFTFFLGKVNVVA